MRVGVNLYHSHWSNSNGYACTPLLSFPVNSQQSLKDMHHSLLGYSRQLGGSVFDTVCLAICPLIFLALQNN